MSATLSTCLPSPCIGTEAREGEDGAWLLDCEDALLFKFPSVCFLDKVTALLTPFVVTGASLPFLAPVGVFNDGAWIFLPESDSESESESEDVLEAEPELNVIVSDKAMAGDREVDFCSDILSNVELERVKVAGAVVLSFSILMLRIMGSILVPIDLTSPIFFP